MIRSCIKWFLLMMLLFSSPLLLADPLQDFAGQPKAVKDYAGQGKWLVVMMWASDCHICNVEAEHYIQFHEEYKSKNAHVLGISLDGQARKAEAEKFIQRHDVTFPNLIGEPAEVVAWFNALTGAPWIGTPTLLIYDPKGQLVVQQVGAVPVNIIEDFIRENS